MTSGYGLTCEVYVLELDRCQHPEGTVPALATQGRSRGTRTWRWPIRSSFSIVSDSRVRFAFCSRKIRSRRCHSIDRLIAIKGSAVSCGMVHHPFNESPSVATCWGSHRDLRRLSNLRGWRSPTTASSPPTPRPGRSSAIRGSQYLARLFVFRGVCERNGQQPGDVEYDLSRPTRTNPTDRTAHSGPAVATIRRVCVNAIVYQSYWIDEESLI